MEKKINKIIITGDILRPQPDGKSNAQLTNISWLYHLIKSQINTILEDKNLKVEMLQWREGCFDSKIFYTLNNMQSFPKDWVAIYGQDDISEEAEDYFLNFFKNSVVIGFELPHIFINLFNKHHINYIDIIIHPVRYLEDLLLALRTNNEQIFNIIKIYQVDSYQFELNAFFHKAKLSRLQSLDLNNNSAFFAGQIELDKSLIKDKECLSILSFKKEFADIASRYDTLYFKKHPYAKDNYEVDNFLQTIPNIKYTDANFYHILAQDEIKAVYSISSSTVYEAKFWGKEAHYLYKNPFDFLQNKEKFFDKNKYIPIKYDFLLPMFWHDILTPLFQTIPKQNIPNIEIMQKTNFFRNSLNVSWGYEFLDQSVQTIRFSSNNNDVESILSSISDDVKKFKRNLLNSRAKTVSLKAEYSLFRKYQTSFLFIMMQHVKKVPLVGRVLLFLKHKILKWNV